MDGYVYRISIDSNGNAVLPALSSNAKKTDTSLRGMEKGGRGASQSITTLGNSSNKANVGLKRIAGTLAAIGLTLSVGAIGKNIVSTGMAFESSMSTVKAISNATEEEFISLQKAARDAGATTVFSASQAADAMGYLAQAGFKANQQIAAIPGTLNLAAAGSLELATAADITANTLAQFGMAAGKSEVVADQLAFTANSFNTNVTEIAEAMKYFGPVAHAFGISLAESNAVIGLVANNGLKGSMATRALSTALTRLASPTKQMREMMSALNLSFFDAQGNFVGFAEMVGRVEKATESLTQQQKQEALSVIFGSEALKDMNPLVSAGAEEIRKWTNELENAHGTAQRMADVKLDNLSGDVRILKSVYEEFALSLYDNMQPALRGITQSATGFIRSLDAQAIGSVLGTAAKGVYTLTSYLIKNFDTIVTLGKGYLSLKVGMLGYNTATKIATILTGILDKTIVLSPWGLIAAGIATAASALLLFGNRSKDVTLANQGVIDGLYKERAQVNLLAAELRKAETPLERRKEIIEELRRIQPDIVEGINAEAVAYSQLATNVAAYNRQKVNEIVLEKKKGELANLQDAAATALMSREELEERIPGMIGQMFDEVRTKITRSRSLSDTEKQGLIEKSHQEQATLQATWENKGDFDHPIAGVGWMSNDLEAYKGRDKWLLENMVSDFRKARGSENQAMEVAEKFTEGLNQYADKIGAKLFPENNPESGNSDWGGTITPPLDSGGTGSQIPGAAETSEKIVKGGTSQRIINITVHKFQDTVNNYLGGSDANGDQRRQLDQFNDEMAELFMRVVNSANQTSQ